MTQTSTPWWLDAVVYQVYPRSWADGDGDGIGDLPGITERLDHLADLGVDALWLSPFYTSPQNDAGYDVADYRDVDPRFGTLDDFDAMVARAHGLGLKVIVDIVPNHSSSEHVWFQAALAAEPGSPERARYIFREGRGDDGSEPPNNWQSNFGGPAWTRVTEADGTPGQWYLNLFDSTQPDFDWTNPEVAGEFDAILRFWLDRGVDGFRIDVAHGMMKAEGLPDAPDDHDEDRDPTSLLPMWDQPEVHDIYRRWRKLVDEYDGDRMLCAEAWVLPSEALALYVRPDELHQSFNFPYLMTPWIGEELRATITQSLAAADAVGAAQTWVLSNHDVIRHASRLGFAPQPGLARFPGIGPDDPQPDADAGLRRARAATAQMLALPGGAYLYQGEELGLPEVTSIPEEVREDPRWPRSGYTDVGRDGCRVPVPWSGDAPSYGFNTTGTTWLPQPDDWAPYTPEAQRGVPGSTLEFYRAALRIRREFELGRGRLTWRSENGPDVVAFDIETDQATVSVLTNLGPEPVATPDGAVLLISGELDADGTVPTDVTVWIRTA